MITRISLAFALLYCSATWAADTVQSLNIKPGLWETTRTIEMSGQPFMPPEAREAMANMQAELAKMPLADRAKVEAMLKMNASKIGEATMGIASELQKPTVRRDCVKKEGLDKPFKFDDIAESCTRTFLSVTSSRQEMRVQCTNGGMKQNVSFRLDVINSENVKISMQETGSDGTHTSGMNSTVTAKWIGPVCDSKDQKR